MLACRAPPASPWHLPVRPRGGILSKIPRPRPGLASKGPRKIGGNQSRCQRLRSQRREDFFAQESDLLVPIGVAESEIVNDMIRPGPLVGECSADNVLWRSGENETFDVVERRESTGRGLDPSGIFLCFGD